MENENKKQTQQAVEVFLRIGLLVLVLYWCFEILSPFIVPFLWGVIIAVAVYPLQLFFQKRLRDKKILTSVLITIIMLAVIIIPVSIFISTMTDSILILKTQIESGEIAFKAPSEAIKQWPIIGERLYDALLRLFEHTEDTIKQYQTELTEIGKKILTAIVGTGLSILQLLLSIIIAGVLLATKGTERAAIIIMSKLVDSRGEDFVKIMTNTIRNVVKGVLGVAVIQTILAGFGLYLSGVPNSGVLILLCLILSIVQIGPGLVIIPSVAYLYMHNSTMTAVLWTIYFIGVLTSDNILKPILLGKGASVPMLVIFLGVIGGFIMSGIIGLFTGAIVLSLGYKLLLAWMNIDVENEEIPATTK
jgi:predicted PurR-regulated permease PerM